MSSHTTDAAIITEENALPLIMPGRRLRRRNRIEIALFIVPALFFQLILGWYPLVIAFGSSLTDMNLMQTPKFTGLQSFVRVWNDPLVAEAFKTTLIYSTMNIALTFMIPIVIAIFLMEMPPKFMRWLMILWFLPLSGIANAILWRYLYDTQYGLLEYIAQNIFHLSHQDFINNPQQVLFWLIFPGLVIFGPGLSGLAYMGALQGVPTSYFEAAEVEGASFWRKIFTISIPRLRPIISVLMVYGIINGFQEFTWIQLMTGSGSAGSAGGGVGGAARTVVIYLYSLIQSGRYSDATALSIFLFMLTLAATILFRTFFKEDPDA
jgi:multiple sugar transport system permease protein